MWNWQQPDWPHFSYENSAIAHLETQFLHQAGILVGVTKHVLPSEKLNLVVELLSDEALKTSEIEGEYLDTMSLRSSILRHFGLPTDQRKIPAREAGITAMMLNLYETYQAPLTHEALFNWHMMLSNESRYRVDLAPMQIISGPLSQPKIHFEAPASEQVTQEMDAFINWFNNTAPGNKNSLPALTRAAITHLYFVSIHPFEDGNGRIARALALKSLFQNLGDPALIALSHTIQNHKNKYYDSLDKNNKKNQITDWLKYFSETILSAQQYTLNMVEFLINKAKFYDLFKDKLNTRQEKVINKIFHEGIENFKTGLSAENYLRITNTSRATATRDLQHLVAIGAFTKYGALKGTRYELKM